MHTKIFIYRADFKIRSKADAEKFLHMHTGEGFGHYDGELYWNDGKYDYRLNAKAADVSSRLMSERGNIFSPYFCDGNEESYLDTIWKTRKYINAQIFPNERW